MSREAIGRGVPLAVGEGLLGVMLFGLGPSGRLVLSGGGLGGVDKAAELAADAFLARFGFVAWLLPLLLLVLTQSSNGPSLRVGVGLLGVLLLGLKLSGRLVLEGWGLGSVVVAAVLVVDAFLARFGFVAAFLPLLLLLLVPVVVVLVSTWSLADPSPSSLTAMFLRRLPCPMPLAVA